jgi:Ala-tRNA(Pro) deacylase
MAAAPAIHELLHTAHVPYLVVPHPAAYSAQEEAAATHVPGRCWAKVVTCYVDGQPVEAVLPAPFVVNLDRLLELTGGTEIRLAQEIELRQLYPNCEVGAMPPLGSLYGQAVFADIALAHEPELVFAAGTHSDAIAMRWPDFARIVKPIVGWFAEPPMDRVGSYRLSYRE